MSLEMDLNKMNDWIVGISPWIINDGKYSEFYSGQIVEFGLHLHLKDVQITNSAEKRAVSKVQSKYEFVGEITYIDNSFLILDFGVEGYSKFRTPPSYAKVGQCVEGRIQLSIDDFFLSYTLANTPHPPLIYTWRINQVVEKVTPVVFEKNSRGVEVGRYIHSEEKQTVVPRTDALHAGIGVSYLLHCTKLDFSPK